MIMIDLGIQDNTIEIINDLEFYSQNKSELRLKERQIEDNKITLYFDCLAQSFDVRICVDDLTVLAQLPKAFERNARIHFRAWTEVHLPAWYYIDDLVIEKNPDEDESLWQARCRLIVSLQERKNV